MGGSSRKQVSLLDDIDLVTPVIILVYAILGWIGMHAGGTSSQTLGVMAMLLVAIAFGPVARWGVFFGFLVTGGLTGDLLLGSVTGVGGYFAVIIYCKIWRYPDPQGEAGRWTVLYALTAPVGVVAYAAIVSGISDILGQVSFSVAVIQITSVGVPAVFAAGPAVWLVNLFTFETKLHTGTETPSLRNRTMAAVGVLLWAAGGFVGSFMFRAVDEVPADRIGERFLTVAETFVNISGHQGVRVVSLYNIVFVSLLLLFLYTQTPRNLRNEVNKRWN